MNRDEFNAMWVEEEEAAARAAARRRMAAPPPPETLPLVGIVKTKEDRPRGASRMIDPKRSTGERGCTTVAGILVATLMLGGLTMLQFGVAAGRGAMLRSTAGEATTSAPADADGQFVGKSAMKKPTWPADERDCAASDAAGKRMDFYEFELARAIPRAQQ